jgi:hypothetical protein
LAAPIKLMGVLDLGIELCISLTFHPKLMPQWDWEWCLLTQMIVGAALGIKPHHNEDPISHQHFVVLAFMH